MLKNEQKKNPREIENKRYESIGKKPRLNKRKVIIVHEEATKSRRKR